MVTGLHTEFPLAIERMQQCNDAGIVADVNAAVDFLKGQSSVNGKIGIVGFCFGGRVAYLAACTNSDLSALPWCSTAATSAWPWATDRRRWSRRATSTARCWGCSGRRTPIPPRTS